MTFSMPIMETWMGGRDVERRWLPSFSTRTMVPVSAMPKFAPVTPMSAWLNFSRRACRAIWVKTLGVFLVGDG